MSSQMLVLPFLRYPFDKIILYIGLTDWSSALSHLKIALHSYHCQETQCIIDIRVKFLSFSAPTFENSSRNKTMLHSLKCLKCWSHSTFFIKIRKLFNFFYSVAHAIYTTKNSYVDSVGSGSFRKKLLLLLLLLFVGSFLWSFYCKQALLYWAMVPILGGNAMH